MYLFVCTLGRSRSRTAEVLATLGGADARCCGINKYALVPINNNLISEASKIICMGAEHEEYVKSMASFHQQPIITLNIGDIYSAFEDTLVDRILSTVKPHDLSLYNTLKAGRELYLGTRPDGFYSTQAGNADSRLPLQYKKH